MKETGKTKHYGVHNVTHKRLILLCLENPEKKGFTLGVDYDLLDAESRNELINIIDGPEAQSVKDAYVVLKKHFFTEHPSLPILKWLQNNGFIKEYNVNDITMFIEANRTVPLTEIIKQVNAYEAWKLGQNKEATFYENDLNAPAPSAPIVESTPEPVVQKPAEVHPAPQPDATALLAEVLSKLSNKLDDIGNKLDKLSTNEPVEAKSETKAPSKAKKKK